MLFAESKFRSKLEIVDVQYDASEKGVVFGDMVPWNSESKDKTPGLIVDEGRTNWDVFDRSQPLLYAEAAGL